MLVTAGEPTRDTCEELQVGKRFGQDAATLLLHRQGDDHETVGQLREVFDEVVVPAERRRTEWEGRASQDAAAVGLFGGKKKFLPKQKKSKEKGTAGASSGFSKLQMQSWAWGVTKYLQSYVFLWVLSIEQIKVDWLVSFFNLQMI